MVHRGFLTKQSVQPGTDSTLTDSLPESLSSSKAGGSQEPSQRGASLTNWPALVDSIGRGEETGIEDLYRLFGRGVRYFLCRQLGHRELDDKVRDTFAILVEAIRRGELIKADHLTGFVRTVVRRQVARYVDEVGDRRRNEQVEVSLMGRCNDPEENASLRERVELLVSVLGDLSDRDREVLKRFYIDEQSQEEICREMGLSETQFRLLKSRAKERFSEIEKDKLVKKPVIPVSRRRAYSA